MLCHITLYVLLSLMQHTSVALTLANHSTLGDPGG